MQEVFVNSDIVFWPQFLWILWILSLLTQFSGLTTLLSLVLGEALQVGLIKLGLVFKEWRSHI